MNTSLPTITPNTAQKPASGSPERARKRLLLATVITLALWYVPYSNFLLYPLRLFITFVHESGHALATLATGGQVLSVALSPNGSGVTHSLELPLWAWLILSGGYLGTTVFGALLLQMGRFTTWRNAGRASLYVMAGFVLVGTLLWARDPFTFPVGLILAAALWGLARLLTLDGANFLAAFLAVQCCLNAIGDLRILLLLTTNNGGDNDAVFMARAYPFLPPAGWALLWAAMALVILGFSLRSYWRATARRSTALLR